MLTAGLDCLGHVTISVSSVNSTQVDPPNYCVYYHIYKNHKCTSSTHLRGSTYFVDRNLNDRCGPLEEMNDTSIFCLCNSDNCNSDSHVMEILTKEDTMTELNVAGIESNPHANHAVNLFLCMKRELGLNVVNKAENVAVGMRKTWLVIAILVIILAITVMVCVVTALIIRKRNDPCKFRKMEESMPSTISSIRMSTCTNTMSNTERAASKNLPAAKNNCDSSKIPTNINEKESKNTKTKKRSKRKTKKRKSKRKRKKSGNHQMGKKAIKEKIENKQEKRKKENEMKSNQHGTKVSTDATAGTGSTNESHGKMALMDSCNLLEKQSI